MEWYACLTPKWIIWAIETIRVAEIVQRHEVWTHILQFFWPQIVFLEMVQLFCYYHDWTPKRQHFCVDPIARRASGWLPGLISCPKFCIFLCYGIMPFKTVNIFPLYNYHTGYQITFLASFIENNDCWLSKEVEGKKWRRHGRRTWFLSWPWCTSRRRTACSRTVRQNIMKCQSLQKWWFVFVVV